MTGEEKRRVLYFFLQAEDGIRDRNVTGVQTCALPISTPIHVTRLTQAVNSARRSAKEAAYAEGFARTTRSTEGSSPRSSRRRISRRRRRTRLRATAVC